MVWAKSSDAPDAVRAALDARDQADAEERNRLLYVAMTRAESWLIIAGSGDMGKQVSRAWYLGIRDAMEASGAVPLLLPELPGQGMRLESGDWSPMARVGPQDAAGPAILPDWVNHAAPTSKRAAKARTPSDLGGAKALQGDGLSEVEAKRRGRLVHLLLEHLPKLPEPSWIEAAPGILALDPGEVADVLQADVLSEATRVLTARHLSAIFAPDTLAEVALTGESDLIGGPIMGIIDRLLVTDDTVTAIDFKTNAVVPDRPQEVPEGLLRQMGAYAAMLAAIYPDRRIETAILWSRTAELMILPHDIVSAALDRARGA